ncbi:MAG: thioredoxin family protein [Flavobacteriaceae bacterium]
MTKTWLGIVMFSLSICASAQDWQPEYALALTKAETTKKPLILVFAGTDWCAPCIKLDREVWQSETFKGYAKDHYVLYRADFPRKKSNQLSQELSLSNNVLAERFNPQGHFPLVIVIDSKEQVLGSTGYQKLPPEQYISLLNSFLK